MPPPQLPPSIPPPPPPSRGMPPPGLAVPSQVGPSPVVDPEIQKQIAEAEQKVRAGRRRSWLIGLGAVLALLLGLWAGWSYFSATVLTYAELDGPVGLVRNPESPDELTLSYRACSPGLVGFSRSAADRQTELLESAADSDMGRTQKFCWNIHGLDTGDVVRVTHRDGWGLVTDELAVPDIVGLYTKRTLANRSQWIGQCGGSEESEKAVAAGLDWLARHQSLIGFWSAQNLRAGGCCEAGSPCDGAGNTFEIAQTGLSLLAFHAAGHYPNTHSQYADTVARGLKWLIEQQNEDGMLATTDVVKRYRKKKSDVPTTYMYEHGMAAFALADACAAAYASGKPPEEKYLVAAAKAIRFIEQNQHTDGGWRYTPDLSLPSDTSVAGWSILALASAREADLPVSDRTIGRVRSFLEARKAHQNGRTYYLPGSIISDATTGVGMLGRQFLLEEPDDELIADAAKYLAAKAETSWDPKNPKKGSPDYYLWYNCTLAMFQAGGEPWKRWNGVVRDVVIGRQRHDGCMRGSWDPDGPHGSTGGRIISTAFATLALETYYRYTSRAERESGVVRQLMQTTRE